jgi:hypothetical protein
MGAESMFDDPAAHGIDGRDAEFGIDVKILPADRAANF